MLDRHAHLALALAIRVATRLATKRAGAVSARAVSHIYNINIIYDDLTLVSLLGSSGTGFLGVVAFLRL